MTLPASPISTLSVLYEKNPALKVLMALVPGEGFAHELLQARGQEIIEERNKLFFEQLGAGSVTLNEELINSNDFLHCFFKTVKAAQQTRKTEKIQLLAKMLRNVISSLDVEFDQYEELLDALDDMSLREVHALQLLYRHEVASKTSIWETEISQINSYWNKFQTEACALLNLEEKEFGPFIARLVRTGFYRENNESFYDDTPKVGITTRQFEKLIAMTEFPIA
jgi:hypothetical protein